MGANTSKIYTHAILRNKLSYATVIVFLTAIACFSFVFASSSFAEIPTPRQQLADGVEPENIECKEYLVLVLRDNANPICITPATAKKLEERQQILVRAPTAANNNNNALPIPPGFSTDEHQQTINDKPITITLKGEVWADNWFALYLDQNLIAEDSVSINTERSFNSETFTFDVTYPIHLNFIVKDYKQDDSGLEYIGTDRQQIGDGGFIAQFTDTKTSEIVAVTDETALCTVIHKAPLNDPCVSQSSSLSGAKEVCEFESLQEPPGWKSAYYDTSTWSNAVVYSENQVQPKDGYDQISWSPDAKLIWSEDLKLDNTLLCKITVDSVPPKLIGTEGASPFATQSHLQDDDDDDATCSQKAKHFIEDTNVWCDDEFLYVESDSLADHQMMVGITAWNQQVPLPQPFFGQNAMKIPLHPQMADDKTPLSGTGLNAISNNGIPIFNPTQQDGIYDESQDPYLIGELDACGGHSGRADDYHYHIAPHCTQQQQENVPIAYALDGYPIYPYEPNKQTLDECNGEYDDKDNEDSYHYHASPHYPYINGCFSGMVDFGNQPAYHPVRPAGEPVTVLITDLYEDSQGWNHLKYDYQGESRSVSYIVHQDNSCYTFKYSSTGLTQEYCGESQTPQKNQQPRPQPSTQPPQEPRSQQPQQSPKDPRQPPPPR